MASFGMEEEAPDSPDGDPEAAGPGGEAAVPGGKAAGPGGKAAGPGGKAAGPGGKAAVPGSGKAVGPRASSTTSSASSHKRPLWSPGNEAEAAYDSKTRKRPLWSPGTEAEAAYDSKTRKRPLWSPGTEAEVLNSLKKRRIWNPRDEAKAPDKWKPRTRSAARTVASTSVPSPLKRKLRSADQQATASQHKRPNEKPSDEVKEKTQAAATVQAAAELPPRTRASARKAPLWQPWKEDEPQPSTGPKQPTKEQKLWNPMDDDASDAAPTKIWSPSGEGTSDGGQAAKPGVFRETEQPFRRERSRSPTPSTSDDRPVFKPEEYYSLVSEAPIVFRGGNVTSSNFKVAISKPIPGEGIERMEYVLAIIKSAFDDILRSGDQDDIGQVFMRNPNLYNEIKPSRRLPLRELTFDDLVEKLYAAEQSSGLDKGEDAPGGVVRLEDTTFTLVVFKRKTAGGGHAISMESRSDLNYWDWCKKKRCTINPMAKRNRIPADLEFSCIPYSVVIGLRLLEMGHDPYSWKADSKVSLKAFHNFSQSVEAKRRVRELIAAAGLQGPGPYAIHDVALIQAHLGDEYQLTVYESSAAPVASFGPDEAPKHINLFVKDGEVNARGEVQAHCVLITNMAAFMGKGTFCKMCKKTGPGRNVHRCEASTCKECNIYGCLNREPRQHFRPVRQCEDCNVPFFTEACYNAHKGRTCAKKKRCLNCYGVHEKRNFDKHKCGLVFCGHCGKTHKSTGFCYVHPVPNKVQPQFLAKGEDAAEEDEEEDEEGGKEGDAKPKSKPIEIWYADAETFVDPVTGQHKANLLILQSPVKDGPPAEVVYRGPNAMSLFTEECIRTESMFKDTTIIFHNGSKFDAHLFYRELMLLELPPRVIFKGQAILSMDLRQNKIKVRDSLQFLPGTPLARFPATFGLAVGLVKGDFPHGANVPRWVSFDRRIVYEEEDAEGAIHRFPQLHYFCPGNKRPKERRALEKWHRSEVARYAADPSLEYVASEVLESYCRLDVRILLEGFETFRAGHLGLHSDMEPLESLTLPSFSNSIFRTKYMKPESISLLPPEGHSWRSCRSSKEAFSWLSCMERELEEAGTPLTLYRDARRSYEVKIAGLKVDGYGEDCNGGKHVFQYHGCFYHGCPCQDVGEKRRTPQQLIKYDNTLDNDARLEEASAGVTFGPYTYHKIWGCEFKRQRTGNRKGWYKEHVKTFYERWSSKPLRPRDAMHGGRTNCIKHKVIVDPEKETLYYYDFNSHYPAVNYGMHGETWPVGMPKIFIGADVSKAPPLSESYGLWQCVVLPPRRLKHPVIGETLNDKYTFHLCRTCAAEERQGLCDHTDKQREMDIVIFSGELELALEKGYKIVSVSEVWDWVAAQRDPDMFRAMIREQYRGKACSSAVNRDDLPAIIAEFKETMDLDLKIEDFVENPGLRTINKGSLNHLWGFFGKRNNQCTTEVTKKLSDLTRLDSDSKREITSVKVVMGGEYLQIQHRPVVEPATRSGSLVLAIITTAYARMELYRLMDKYADQVVYFDTDSVFLLIPHGMEPPKTSAVLGGLKDEVLAAFGPGHRIASMHSLGPKTYSFKVVNAAGETVFTELKAKGISLSSDAVGVVTPELIQRLVEEREDVARVPQFQIARDVSECRLYSRNFDKAFRFASTKRWFLPEPNASLNTRPYGYSAL